MFKHAGEEGFLARLPCPSIPIEYTPYILSFPSLFDFPYRVTEFFHIQFERFPLSFSLG